MSGPQWVLLVGALPALGFGVLNVIAPALTTKWQVSATGRRVEGDSRKAFGSVVAVWMGISGSSDPTRDVRVLRRVRLLGTIEVVVTAVLAGGLWRALA